MEQVAIAALNPELPAPASKQFRAVVTLIWPYSSSQRQFALLLGDPSFRLRRKAGQVRARFSGSSAKAIASTGVGIGDEVVLSLSGAEFVQDGSVSTPGKSIDWELSYTQTLSARVVRNGIEIASLDLNNVAPTPAPGSPVRRQPPVVLDETQKWSSPAFIKRTRLSDGPVFEAGYDPFNDDTANRHDRKRRRKSYKDWTAWTYSARTPSPEKEDVDMEDDASFAASPIRPLNLPDTPVSPSKPGAEADTDRLSDQLEEPAPNLDLQLNEDLNNHADGISSLPQNDPVRDADYYDLYAGPDEVPPPEFQDAFKRDTVPNIKDEGSSAIHSTGYVDLVESDAEDTSGEGTEVDDTLDAFETLSASGASATAEEGAILAEHYGAVEIDDFAPVNVDAFFEDQARIRDGPVETSSALDGVPDIVMPPPPALPLLQTNFQTASVPGLLTPIGKEPSSPALLPLDSATLPMPSPFPGERDGEDASFLYPADHISSDVAQHQPAPDEDDYIIETSFYSSVSAANASATHATHESAFTDVRFNFGLDGSAFSRTAAPSEPNEVQGSFKLLDESSDAESEKIGRCEEGGVDDSDAQVAEDLPKAQASSPPPVSHKMDQQAEIAPEGRGLAEVDAHLSEDLPEARASPPQPETDHEEAHGLDEANTHMAEDMPDVQASSPALTSHETRQHVESNHDEELEADEADVLMSEDLPEAQASSPLSATQQHAEVIELSSDSHSGVDAGLEAVHGARNKDDSAAESHDVEMTISDAVDQLDEHNMKTNQTSIWEEFTQEPVEVNHSATGHTSVEMVNAEEHLPAGTQRSEAGTEIIDLGSGSDGENEPEGITQTDQLPITHLEAPKSHNVAPVPDDTAQERFYPDLEAVERSPARSDAAAAPDDLRPADQPSHESLGISSEEQASAHSVVSLPDTRVEPKGEDHNLSDDEAHMAPNEPRDFRNSVDVAQEVASHDDDTVEDDHSDIKMESIEEGDVFEWTHTQPLPAYRDGEQMPESSGELLIAVPEEGHKVGDLHIVSVPATGPARNTRSKTKTSMSPTKEDTPAPKRSTWSKTAKGPIKSVERTTLSPLAQRSVSTASPTKDVTITSPYSLRSQSKRPSRTESATPVREPRNAHKKATKVNNADANSPSQHSVADVESLHSEDVGFSDFSFGPSQELGLSQRSRFSNVTFVKDSEEGSIHSANSLSTVQYSDDWNMGTQQPFTNESDPIGPNTEMFDMGTSPSKPRPVDRGSPATPTKLGPKTRWKAAVEGLPAKSTPAQPDYSLLTQLSEMSPARSGTPTEAATSSPRRSRRLRKDVYDIPADEEVDQTAQGTVGDAVTYPTISVESDGVEPRSSLPPSPIVNQLLANIEQLPSSPPPTQTEFISTNPQSQLDANSTVTPDATQQTVPTSRRTPVSHQEQSMPITPQLTQTTSAGQRSFNLSMKVESPFTKPSPTTEFTPRRNVTATDVASDPASSTTNSAQLSDTEKDPPKPELPSVGLSTPIAYYTPIRDLPFFLNRSSQFHSSSSPDILALVTSTNTAPKRATSGPKHHTTTFHITDVSSYPASTTVQVFRPYVTALPVAEKGDVVLLRAFNVKSLNRRPMLVSGEESAWCVWRYGKLLWGKKKEVFGEIKEREEVKGPAVERGEGEWREVEKIRGWYLDGVKGELEAEEAAKVKTRSKDKVADKEGGEVEG
jgi:hypothetical protein